MKRKIALTIFVVLILYVFSAALAASWIPGVGLRKSRETLSVFGDKVKGGFSLRFQEDLDRGWGFFEWPDRRLYGFVSFDGKVGNVRKGTVTSGTGKGSAVELKDEASGGSVSIDFSGQGLPGEAIHLARRSEEDLPRLLGFSGRGGRRFRLELFADSPGGSFPFLDARLRRGKNPLDYAVDLLGRTSQTSGLEERQYWLGSVNGYLSVATERDLSEDRGREERFFGFTTVDSSTGEELVENDLFKPGGKEALPPLLSREAKRILGANAGNGESGKNATSGDLRSYGLFDEDIKPSTGFFLCESGMGFHYDRYELAPYSKGDFTFVLPWKDLAGLMKKNGEP